MADNGSFKILWSLFYLLGALTHAGKSNLLATRQAQHRQDALKNFEVMAPPDVPREGKVCEVVLLQHTFANSYGHPARVAYSPPTNCGEAGTWASVVFNLTTTSQGTQYDRLGLMYLNNVEIWRTSTAEPTRKGIIWTALRDMTRYMPLLTNPNELLFTLNNIVDPKRNLTGKYEVTLSASFYEPTLDYPAAMQLDEVITVGNVSGQKIERQLKFPQNIASAFVEIYASGNAQEEFWYTNVPDEYISRLDPNKTADVLGRGSFREVQLWIDGFLAGVVYPFPVIYTGGILLSWWRPITAIGAFEAPSFTLDITPFVPLLADCLPHNFTINVHGDGSGDRSTNPEWIISGSVGFSLDPSGRKTTGKLASHETRSSVKTTPLSRDQKGRLVFTTDASRDIAITAEVVTGSSALQKVRVEQKLAYFNKQTWVSGGTFQSVQQLSNGSTVSWYNEDHALSDHFTFPLNLTTATLPAEKNGTLITGHLSHGYTREERRPYPRGWNTTIVTDQDSDGELRLNSGGRAVSGIGRTSQRYSYTNGRGEDYMRDVEVFNVTRIVRDKISGTLADAGSVYASPQPSSPEYNDENVLEGAPCRIINALQSKSSKNEEEAYLVIQEPYV
ncbi:hypothetical protein CROQUDRAFT_719785 [Cronartium quercuum f. sp. fusiforme G11]|uniref:Peptide N-acetyl-beta-D-glucosaminyl asparaginase amidase A N-terminal domain-containing protein n=1 Tax=Cronartium quercuum f. sp. fusiforme G11 TaxID=708437 RepID=A0A9P6NWH6_9BASI|nr:hypothetical protein CROQUDRAFT_719785 [Cronartium quercuum f. sp. fusiforme G11]